MDCDTRLTITGVGRSNYEPPYGKLDKLTGEVDNCAGQMMNREIPTIDLDSLAPTPETNFDYLNDY